MPKRVIRWPDCRCGWYSPHSFCCDFDRTKERGEWVPIPICRKNLGCLYWVPYEYTPLKQCAHCKRTGRQVKYRGDCYLGLDAPGELDLCMACWNRYRPIVKRIRRMRECQKLANKIRRVAQQKRRES